MVSYLNRHLTPVSLTLLLLLTGILLLCYSNGMNGSFHSDDYQVIELNPHIGELEEKLATFPPGYRHFLDLSYAINYRLNGLDTFGYHVFNLALHILSSGLVFWIVFSAFAKGWKYPPEHSFTLAGLTAGFFALHPAHTEVIAYIGGRSSGLSAFFALLCIGSFVQGSLVDTKSRLTRGAWYLLAAIAAGCAVLSKETTLVLPLALFWFDFCLMGTEGFRPRKHRFRYFYIPLVVLGLSIAFASSTFRLQLSLWWDRIDLSIPLKQVVVLVYALKVWLFPLNLTFDYDFSPKGFLDGVPFVLSLAFWACLIVCVLRFRQQKPAWVTFCVGWFLIILAPTNSILPRMDLLSERNLYLPSFGLSLAAGAGILALIGKARTPLLKFLSVTAVLILLLCHALLIPDRNRVYQNDVTLWEDTYSKSPQKTEVHYYLAMAYSLAGDLARAHIEMTDLAINDPSLFEFMGGEDTQKVVQNYFKLLQDLREALNRDPENFRRYGHIYQELASLAGDHPSLYYTRIFLGNQHIKEGRLKMAEREFNLAQKARPHLPEAYINLGALHATRGLYSKALDLLNQAEQRIHLTSELLYDLKVNQARVLMDTGNYSEAEQKLLALEKEWGPGPESEFLKIKIYSRTQRWNEALERLGYFKGTDSLRALAEQEKGFIHWNLKEFSNARQAFENALDLNPKLAPARFTLAKILIDTGGDPILARHHLEEAEKLSAGNPEQIRAIHQLLTRIEG